jgi:hypothetical protein
VTRKTSSIFLPGITKAAVEVDVYIAVTALIGALKSALDLLDRVSFATSLPRKIIRQHGLRALGKIALWRTEKLSELRGARFESVNTSLPYGSVEA